MIFNKKMLGSCCVGLALLLSGEGFCAEATGDITVSFGGGQSKVLGRDTVVAAYNTLKESKAFMSLSDEDKVRAVEVLALLDGGFNEVKVEGYDPSNKVGIVALVERSAEWRFLDYYDAKWVVENGVKQIISNEKSVATPAFRGGDALPVSAGSLGEGVAEAKGKSVSGGLGSLVKVVTEAKGKSVSGGLGSLVKVVTEAKEESVSGGLGSLVKAKAEMTVSSSGQGIQQEEKEEPRAFALSLSKRSVSPTKNYGITKDSFEKVVLERSGKDLPQGWDIAPKLTGEVGADVVEILFGGKKFLATYSALEAAQRHFNDEGVKPNPKAFLELVQAFVAQDGKLAEALSDLEKMRSESVNAITGEAAKVAGEFLEAMEKGKTVVWSVADEDGHVATFVVSIDDLLGGGGEHGFPAFNTDENGRILNPINPDNVGVYNKAEKAVVTLAEAAEVQKVRDATHIIVDAKHRGDVDKLNAGGHHVVNDALAAAVADHSKLLNKIDALKEFAVVVSAINSGAAVFGNGRGAQGAAQGEVDAKFGELAKVVPVFSVDVSGLKTGDIAVLNSIAGKLLTGDWSALDDTTGVEDAALKGVLDTAKTADVADGDIANLITAQFGVWPGAAIDANAVRRSLLIAALAGKDANAIKTSIDN